MISMNELSPLLSALIDNMQLKKYPKNQTIFYQNDTLQEVAILDKGYIKVYDIDNQGNEKILHILRPGAIAPLSFFSGNQVPIRWYFAGLTDCNIYLTSITKMNTLVANNGRLALFLMHWFSLEMHELLVRLSSLGKSNTQIKIIAALNFLAVYCSSQQDKNWKRIDFPISHQLLADMTGVTRESAAKIMKNLDQKKLVRNPRQTILEINQNKLQQEIL